MTPDCKTSKMKLCCIFNYAPNYREAIYKRIDETFDTTFYFGREVIGQTEGIPKLNYSLFKRKPVEVENIFLYKTHFPWRTKLLSLPFKDFDVFFITADLQYSYFPFLLLCKLFGKKVYGWNHGIYEFSSRAGELQKRLLSLMTGYFTYGTHARDIMIKLGVSNVHPLYNSLGGRQTIKDHSSDVYTDHFGNNLPNLIFIGRLTTQKKIDWILKACAQHKKLGINYNITIIGDGPQRDSLQQLSRELSILNNVWFYGECHNAEFTAPLLYNADLCVSPGNVGLTAIDALRNGTPVISHNDFSHQGPEYEAIIHGQNGFLYNYNDFEDFKIKIETWLTQHNENRELIRKKCVDVVNDKWNADNQIEILKSIFERSNGKH